MNPIEQLDRIAINVKSHRLLKTLLKENPKLEEIMRNSKNEIEARIGIREWVQEELRQRPQALAFYEGEASGREAFEALSWSDYAAIRLLDYVDHAGRQFEDLNLRGAIAVSTPGIPRVKMRNATKKLLVNRKPDSADSGTVSVKFSIQ